MKYIMGFLEKRGSGFISLSKCNMFKAAFIIIFILTMGQMKGVTCNDKVSCLSLQFWFINLFFKVLWEMKKEASGKMNRGVISHIQYTIYLRV